MDTIQKFAEIRVQRNLSYGEVAKKIGEDKGTIRQVEKGGRKCSFQLQAKIEKFIDKLEPK